MIKDNISNLNTDGDLEGFNGRQSKLKPRKPQNEQLSEPSLLENWFKKSQETKIPSHFDSTL